MNFSELSIKRPVLATVLVLIIIIFGVIGYTSLAVREFPNVDNPIITVSVSYPGANAEVIENQITEPLEQNINGIPGIRSLMSTSSQGMSRITVEFELSVDMETAAVAHVCYVNRIPFLCVRSITDTAEHSGIDNFDRNCETASARAAEVTIGILKMI